MRPTRNLLRPWNGKTGEGRTALIALVVLMVVLSSALFYQRFLLPDRRPPQQSSHAGSAGEILPNQSGTVAGSKLPGTPAPQNPDNPALATESTKPVKFQAPFHTPHEILHSFGLAYSEIYQDYRQHDGIDYSASPGEAVLAAADGKVVAVEENALEGQVVILEHRTGLRSRYAGVAGVLVTAGTEVKGGNPIAAVGQAGPESAERQPYLHFEVWQNGEPIDPQDMFTRE